MDPPGTQEHCSLLLTPLTVMVKMRLMSGTPRDRARVQTLAEIVRIGREHLAIHGASGLSLRAVARDLGVVSSAVYRYVASRDELLTLLVVNGYDELGTSVDAALAEVPADDYRLRFLTIGRSVRAWGLREPATYALLFGSPVPGYQAPGEQTTEPGTRVIRALTQVWEDAGKAGKLADLPRDVGLTTLAADFEKVRAGYGLAATDQRIARGVTVWASLFGCISFEVFGQYGPGTFGDTEALFEYHLKVLAESMGLREP